MTDYQRMEMFNGMLSPFLQAEVGERRLLDRRPNSPHRVADHGWMDGQWYDQHLRKVSKMLTMLLHHSDDQQIRLLRRNRIQGDIVLIDFLQTGVMKRNFPTLCPASLWAMAHCMDKKRFTFGTVTGTDDSLRSNPDFTVRFNRYLVEKRVDPATIELVTIASCAGHSFVITREIPDGESEDIEYLLETSYAKYGSICHGTHLYHDQSILRNGLDVDFGVRAGLSARNMIHFCVAASPRPLKHFGLHCYLDLKVAIGELDLRIMCSKTAQVVLVETSVPPQPLCLARKSLVELGSMCLPHQHDLIVPQGRDADKGPRKEVGKIFNASPLLRPRPTSGPATSSLAPIAETEQPIVIEDEDDAQMTGGSVGSTTADLKATTRTVTAKRHPLLKGSTIDVTKGSSQECTIRGTKATTSCGAVCCSTGTSSGTDLQDGRLPNDRSRSLIIDCILTDYYYIGTSNTNI